jgi:hypothetical protein
VKHMPGNCDTSITVGVPLLYRRTFKFLDGLQLPEDTKQDKQKLDELIVNRVNNRGRNERCLEVGYQKTCDADGK